MTIKIKGEELQENKMDNISHIVFDAYGTLLTPSHFDFRPYLSGKEDTQKALIKALKSAQSLEELLSILSFTNGKEREIFLQKLINDIFSIQPYPETKEVLGELKKRYHISIDSNLVPPYEVPIFSHFGNTVDNIILSFKTGHSKGRKFHYEELLKLLGESPEKILFVGDNDRKDYLGPKRIGMNALQIIREGKQHKESISTLNQLLEILK